MSNPTARAYAGAVATTALEAAATGVWVMAGELPTGKRRLVRVGLAATMAGVGFRLSRLAPDDDKDDEDEDEDGPLTDEPQAELAQEYPSPGETGPTRLNPGYTAAAGGIAIAIMIGSSVLRKRWLVGLDRSGHAHPHRVLALRVAALSFAGMLPARLIEVHEGIDSDPA